MLNPSESTLGFFYQQDLGLGKKPIGFEKLAQISVKMISNPSHWATLIEPKQERCPGYIPLVKNEHEKFETFGLFHSKMKDTFLTEGVAELW